MIFLATLTREGFANYPLLRGALDVEEWLDPRSGGRAWTFAVESSGDAVKPIRPRRERVAVVRAGDLLPAGCNALEQQRGALRCLVTRANRQPAVANYVRKPGDDHYTPVAIDILQVVDGEVADIVTFDGPVFAWFGLPEAL